MTVLSPWPAVQRLLACIALLVLMPVLLALGLAVWLDSPGPAIYAAVRVGYRGRLFTMHKLRTMRWQPATPGGPITAGRDPRVSRVGRLLRRTRLDELPQLWDVVRGDMLLVGPRPEAPEFVDLADPRWQEILTIRPGITGPTQLAFKDESRLLSETDPSAAYREFVLPRKVESDLQYVRTRSWRSDVKSCWRTVRWRSNEQRG